MTALDKLRGAVRSDPRYRHAHNHIAAFAHRLSGWQPPEGQVHWLFIATFPNGGSTALAQLLSTASAAIQLSYNGEGQILIEHMFAKDRWNPDMPIDWDLVRAIWLRQLRLTGKFPCLVIEKSPASMVRMRTLRAQFSDMHTSLVIYTRDPYAVCSSWAYRYRAAELKDPDCDRVKLFEEQGQRYAKLALHLEALRDEAKYVFSYEELADDKQKVLSRLKEVEPMLHDVDMDAKLRVKDYEPQPLKNMNERQIAKLSAEEIDAITRTLEPARDVIEKFGYALRT